MSGPVRAASRTRERRGAWGWLSWLLWGLAWPGGAGTAAAPDSPVARGEYLFHIGGCNACHTAEGGAGLAGGGPLRTPFGTFFAPNITPHPRAGIGAWSDAEFIAAMRQGVAPDGSHYFPAFPYAAYTRMPDTDLLDLKAYLFSRPAVDSPRRDHELPWYLTWRELVRGWKLLFFEPGPYRSDPARSAAWNRGAYLVRGPGHCEECHTPRNALGGLRRDRHLAGSRDGAEGDPVPNITPHRKTGIGTWTGNDIEYFLETGALPDGDYTGGLMADIIDEGLSRLRADDRRAIAEYLLSVPALQSEARD